MLLSLADSLREMLPLLIFIVLPLLGRLVTWLSKRASGVAENESASSSDGRPIEEAQAELGQMQEPGRAAAPRAAGMQAFLQAPAKPKPASAQPVVPHSPVRQGASHDHKRKHETLKEHLLHRGRLSMDDQLETPQPLSMSQMHEESAALGSTPHQEQPASSKLDTWGSRVTRTSIASQVLHADNLSQAMMIHEILSKPLALRESDGLL